MENFNFTHFSQYNVRASNQLCISIYTLTAALTTSYGYIFPHQMRIQLRPNYPTRHKQASKSGPVRICIIDRKFLYYLFYDMPAYELNFSMFVKTTT